MYYIIKFNLQGGEGHLPEQDVILNAFPEMSYEEVLKSHLRFSFNNDNEVLPVKDWKLVDDGLSYLSFTDDGLENGPQPVIWVNLEHEVNLEDSSAWIDVLSSDYVLQVPGINEDEPFYFQDHNGYNVVESAEWLADDLWQIFQKIALKIMAGQIESTTSDLNLKLQKSQNEDYIKLSITFSFQQVQFNYIWFFEDEASITNFKFSDNEYSDSANCEWPEENPLIFKLHELLNR
jgi:hypothetical protein